MPFFIITFFNQQKSVSVDSDLYLYFIQLFNRNYANATVSVPNAYPFSFENKELKDTFQIVSGDFVRKKRFSTAIHPLCCSLAEKCENNCASQTNYPKEEERRKKPTRQRHSLLANICYAYCVTFRFCLCLCESH